MRQARRHRGFSFKACSVAADDNLAYATSVETCLGQPWKSYSRVVFMQCTISDVLHQGVAAMAEPEIMHDWC